MQDNSHLQMCMICFVKIFTVKCDLRCPEDFVGKKSDDDTRGREYIGNSSIIGTKCKVHFPVLLKTKYDTHTRMRKCRCVCSFELLQMMF